MKRADILSIYRPLMVNNHRIDFNGWENEKAYISIDDREHVLKMDYRHEKTWDDHMGNTPCGYYVTMKIGNHSKRLYLDFGR